MDLELDRLFAEEFSRQRNSLKRLARKDGGLGFPMKPYWKPCWKPCGAFAYRVTNPGEASGPWAVIPNGATYVGLNYLLDTGFRGTSQLSSWYAGLINGSGYTAVSINDTASSHAGWTELQNYDEATRRQWSPSAAASGLLTITTNLTVTMDGNRSVQGLFLISNSTKGGTTGTLFATAVEGSPISVLDNAVFEFVYRIQATAVS